MSKRAEWTLAGRRHPNTFPGSATARRFAALSSLPPALIGRSVCVCSTRRTQVYASACDQPQCRVQAIGAARCRFGFSDRANHRQLPAVLLLSQYLRGHGATPLIPFQTACARRRPDAAFQPGAVFEAPIQRRTDLAQIGSQLRIPPG